jgi:hypothetical protein
LKGILSQRNSSFEKSKEKHYRTDRDCASIHEKNFTPHVYLSRERDKEKQKQNLPFQQTAQIRGSKEKCGPGLDKKITLNSSRKRYFCLLDRVTRIMYWAQNNTAVTTKTRLQA